MCAEMWQKAESAVCALRQLPSAAQSRVLLWDEMDVLN